MTITEQSGNDLIDYPVRVDITDPQFFEECPDQKYIECYFQDGSWIPHWTEKFDPANNIAIIWVKVPQIPANGTVKVFIKVNPSRTEDLSNGEAVFEFFDDFEGNELDTNKWTHQWTEGTLLVENSYLKLYTSEDYAYEGIQSASEIFDVGYILEVKASRTSGNKGTAIGATRPGYNIDYDAIAFLIYESTLYMRTRVGNSQQQDSVSDDATKEKIYKISWVSSSEVRFSKIENNVESLLSTHTQYIPSPKLVITLYNYDGGVWMYVDWVRVRKFVDPEPTVSVEYIPETVTYTDYFYWGMAKMLSGAIANLMQLPIKMEIYSGGNLLKTLSLKEISTITDAENKYIVSVLKFEDDSSDSYQTDKQIIYVTDPDGNTRKLAESTYVFIKMAELPLLLGFEIRVPYEDTQVELS